MRNQQIDFSERFRFVSGDQLRRLLAGFGFPTGKLLELASFQRFLAHIWKWNLGPLCTPLSVDAFYIFCSDLLTRTVCTRFYFMLRVECFLQSSSR